AEGAQIGTRFAATVESSAHENYKRKVCEAKENDTTLVLKKLGMARMIKNEFSKIANEAENSCADIEQLKNILGQKRERIGIFEGDENQGMMEAGQGLGLINEVMPVADLFNKLIKEFDDTARRMVNSV
ncbi:MAG: nitronate monooxygenase, partial [Melioribacteraceae bacterium]